MKHLLLSATRTTSVLVALGAAAVLLAPAKQSYGFSKLGGALNVGSERDWRTHRVWADASANNNQTPDSNYPGWQGADMALWKAAAEWGSRPHGNGAGEPTQGTIGSGGANFDFFFGGESVDAGNGNGVVSTVGSCSGGTLAYVAAGGGSWLMRFCENRTWADGPGTIPNSQYDIQGVGCHEFGHSLGLGHSGTFNATMFGSTSAGAEGPRSIANDDIAGLQCIYGVANATKPIITGVSVNAGAGTITITGSNFSPTNNTLWFTSADPTLWFEDSRILVTGVTSPSTTSITALIPAGAGPGDVHVRNTNAGGAGLSNAWPVNVSGGTGSNLAITGISPSTVDCLIPGPDQTVTITGTGFSANTTVTVDGILLDAASTTFVNASTITLDMPQVSQLGSIEVRVDEAGDFETDTITVQAPTTPTLQIGNGIPDFNQNPTSSGDGLDWIYAGPPGEFHYILGSGSNAPSVIPIVSLEIGNNFSDLFAVTSGIIGPEGYLEGNSPLLPTFVIWYFESLSFSQGTPIPTSSRQETLVSP